MKRCILILFALLIPLSALSARATDFSSAFAVVMIDDATESKIGPFPYDRSVMAEAVHACARAGAKAVVLKFFFDQEKSLAGDTALATAMTKIPVVLQARLDDTEGTAQKIPNRFRFGKTAVPVKERGNSGWIPLPRLMDVAADLGFVDFASGTIPLVEEYQAAPYKSLIVCCLELATNEQARIGPGDKIWFGRGFIPVDKSNVYKADLRQDEPIEMISFAALLAEKVDREKIAGRVVIIGWDSSRTPTIDTGSGKTRIHRLFTQCLASCYRALLPIRRAND